MSEREAVVFIACLALAFITFDWGVRAGMRYGLQAMWPWLALALTLILIGTFG